MLVVSEIRSDQSGNGADWSPRDALINLLRDIDAGKSKPTSLVICWREASGIGESSHYSSACKTPWDGLGLLARILHRVNIGIDG